MYKWSIRIQYKEHGILKNRQLVWVDKETKDLLVDLMDYMATFKNIEILGIRMVRIYEQKN